MLHLSLFFIAMAITFATFIVIAIAIAIASINPVTTALHIPSNRAKGRVKLYELIAHRIICTGSHWIKLIT